MAVYESDVTRFLRSFQSERPHLASEKREGRALWWDRPQNLEALSNFQAVRVAQKPYVYQVAPKKNG